MRYNKISAVLNNNINKKCTATEQSRNFYKDRVRLFVKWVKEKEGTERVDPSRVHDLVQEYIIDRFLNQAKSAQTVNSDLVGICAGTGESKRDYYHPPRNYTPIKGREGPGIRTSAGARIYDIASAIGIRQREYQQLRANGIKEKDGYVYVHVPKGKGGKEQWQLVDPNRNAEVKALFSQKANKEYIFTKSECKGIEKSNVHAFRREHARNMYEWYLGRTAEEKRYWRNELKERYLENPQKIKTWEKVEERIKRAPVIYTKGHNKESLMQQGRPTTFDREAVIFVSVFCLAHYRENVAVNNYLV